ncbi:expressed unknown protein [Seminavis robusta]|uniref:Uncharacterized protein n=1 Tax=Seminavis robusta TaxID=568900 RepID=A0A9N8HVT3_9STRA|nr:expressed unknown protein [Seminavis robusta]|eukprot:Sro2413_g326750.1 n/a (246) ;mRNA; f:5250-5987
MMGASGCINTNREGIAQTLTRLNQEGIGHLLANDSQAAVTCFEAALFVVQNQNPAPAPTTTPPPTNDPTQSMLPITLSDSFPFLNANEPSVFIFDQCLSIDMTISGDSSADAQYVATTMIVFNLAVALHYNGMQHQQTKKLQRACHLYSLCASAIVPTIPASFSDPAASYLVTMASLNNHAQIQSQLLGNKEIAAQLALELQQRLVPLFAVASQCNTRIWAPQFVGMLLNIATFLAYRFLASPAA